MLNDPLFILHHKERVQLHHMCIFMIMVIGGYGRNHFKQLIFASSMVFLINVQTAKGL